MRIFATKEPKLANISRSLCKKKHQLEKSTPPLALAVVTNMRYVCYHDICWGISISLSIQSFDKQVLHFRPQITWLKDGIELNSFSEHEHVSFDLSSFFFSSCSKLLKLWWKQQIPDLWVADTEKWDKGKRWKTAKPLRHNNWISCIWFTCFFSHKK